MGSGSSTRHFLFPLTLTQTFSLFVLPSYALLDNTTGHSRSAMADGTNDEDSIAPQRAPFFRGGYVTLCKAQTADALADICEVNSSLKHGVSDTDICSGSNVGHTSKITFLFHEKKNTPRWRGKLAIGEIVQNSMKC